MAEPETSAQATERVIGGDWPDDTHVYSWQVFDEAGQPSLMTFKYRGNGGVLTVGAGDLAIKDARSLA